MKCGHLLCALEEDDDWYIDKGCSHHMYRDKSRFTYFKKLKHGHVIHRNNATTKVIREGRANLDVKSTKFVDILLVEGSKHNILSVIQLDDIGHVGIFTPRG